MHNFINLGNSNTRNKGGIIMTNYSIANLSEEELIAVKEAEALFKQKTGKTYALIAWESK